MAVLGNFFDNILVGAWGVLGTPLKASHELRGFSRDCVTVW